MASESNASLLQISSDLEAFTIAWMNKSPDPSSVRDILPMAAQTFRILSASPESQAVGHAVAVNSGINRKESSSPINETSETRDQAHERILELVWAKLAGVANAIARSQPKLSSEAYAVSREILMASAFLSFSARAVPDREFTNAYWSPTAHTEAIQGLAQLASISTEDAAAVEAFTGFSRSSDPAERFLAITYSPLISQNWPDAFWTILDERSREETNHVIATAILNSLSTVVSVDEDRAFEVARRSIGRTLDQGAANLPNDLVRAMADWVVFLAAYQDESWAWDILNGAARAPRTYETMLSQLLFYLASVITPNNASDPRRGDVVARASDWICALLRDYEGLVKAESLQSAPDSEDPGRSAAHKAVAGVFRAVDEIMARLYFNSKQVQGAQGKMDEEVTSERRRSSGRARAAYYRAVEPMLRSILRLSGPEGAAFMVPRTAHHFMQLLNELLSSDPAGVLNMAAQVAQASRSGGYQFDSLAVTEVVRLVEVVLSDYREELLIEAPLRDTLLLLDIFAEAGWPEALRLVWRLDEPFR